MLLDLLFFFFVNDSATNEIYTYLHTLSLHDALPILPLAVVHVGGDVAADARGRLEAVEFFSGHRIDRLQIALEGAVEDHVAGRREGAGPHRAALLLRPHDLTLGSTPAHAIAEVGATEGGRNREARTAVELTGDD